MPHVQTNRSPEIALLTFDLQETSGSPVRSVAQLEPLSHTLQGENRSADAHIDEYALLAAAFKREFVLDSSYIQPACLML
jgi:hypothetical protein